MYKMEQIKALVFFDLDGTLLGDNSKICPDTLTSLQQLTQNGYLPIIATGRTNPEISEILQETGITSAITMNGQYAVVENKEIINHKIPNQLTQTLLEKTQNFGQELAFYTHQKIKISNHSEWALNHYNHLNQPIPELNNDDLSQQDFNMLLILGNEHDDFYKNTFPELSFYRNTPYSIDVVSLGNSKGTGVLEIKKALGLENIPTYAFGDGPNDLELLEACDYRIAMGNAITPLKEIATFVTSDNTNGGITKGLKHYHLI